MSTLTTIMDEMDIKGTKLKLFTTAVTLFSQRGYTNVSMRDIATEIGIKAASLYNHFSSKNDILEHIYRFYDMSYDELLPDLDETLTLVGKEHPYDILKKCTIFYEED